MDGSVSLMLTLSRHLSISLFLASVPVLYPLTKVFQRVQNRNISQKWAMYKTRNTGTGNGMGGILFRGMSPNIPGTFPAKHFRECPQIFRGMSPNIPGNVLKHSGECHQTFREMSRNIPGNVAKYSGECR